MEDADVQLNSSVSRETLDMLRWYSDQILRWNKTINLISRKTEAEIWHRHILDSAQLFFLAPGGDKWVDVGSGGGLPGLVISILARERWPDLSLVLIESDSRKGAFLRSVIRQCGLAARVVSARAELANPQEADVVSARAMAPMRILLEHLFRHMKVDGVGLLPKGKNWRSEVAAAKALWNFDLEHIESKTSPGAVILKLRNLSRV